MLGQPKKIVRRLHRNLSETRVWSYARWLYYKLKPGRSTPRRVPAVNFETTNICNSKCVFCPYPIMKRKKEPMDMATFKKVVDEIKVVDGNEVYFCVTMGDPLLDPRLFERAQYVQTKIGSKSLGFLTTLQWLHRWNLDEFLSVFHWVQISTSLSGPESYKKFFGVDLYQQMLKNLEALLVRNKELGNPMKVMFSLKPVEDTFDDIVAHPDFKRIQTLTDQDLVAMAKDSGTVVLDDWNGAVKLPDYLKPQLGKIAPRAYLPCFTLYSSAAISSNGNVAPCTCRDYESDSELVVGNVKEQSLMEIWKGEKFQKLRDNWLKKNQIPAICKTCRFYQY